MASRDEPATPEALSAPLSVPPPRGLMGYSRARLARTSLTTRLLLLTILFVMLSEVLIYVPSIARFRETWLNDRLNTALIATLALEGRPDERLPDALRSELLARAEVLAVSVKRADKRELILRASLPRPPDAFYDLRETGFIGFILQAFETLLAGDDRIIRVAGTPSMAESQVIDIVVDEAPLKAAMFAYSGRILAVSILISVVTAGLVYLSLHLIFVGPMRRITDAMVRFRANPEDASRVIKASSRGDEIGTAERALAEMQSELRDALRQKSHLAALGTAVSKVNHDLRNMLASAQLFSDRFATSQDPVVQSQLPKLMRALDRAIALTTDTLRYGRAEEPEPNPRRFALSELVDEVGQSLPPANGRTIRWLNEVERGLELQADPDQVYRILFNIARNAQQALETATRDGSVRVRARREEGTAAVTIEIADDGPGIPEPVRPHLFEPFASGRRAGGTGLGLAISRELARAHGGDLVLVRSDGAGTIFQVTLPDFARLH